MTELDTGTINEKPHQDWDYEAERRTILKTAKPFFAERGFNDVSIDALIAESGIPSDVFYHHFGDKTSVFVTVMKLEVMQFSESLTHIRNSATSLESFIHDSYLHVFRYFHQQPDLFTLIDRNEPQVRELYKFGVLKTTMNDLRKDLEHAVAAGFIGEVDVDHLAAALYGLGYEMIRVMVSRGDAADPAETTRIATDLVINGIRPCC